MSRRRLGAALAVAAALALAPAAEAQLGVAGFGLRGGVGDNPDQVVFGAQVDLGDLIPRLRLQPSLDFAAGEDDADSLSLLVPVHYRFPAVGAFEPYAGGGVQLSWIDAADPGRGGGRDGGDDDFDIAPVAVGGFDLPLGRNAGLSRAFVELALGGGDAYDAKLVVGVMF